MNRTAKQIGYGAFYLAFIALVLFGVFSPEVPSRGGLEVRLPEGLRPLEMRGEVTVMPAADGSISLLAQVRNPNAEHLASSFSYSFRFMENGVVRATTPARTWFVYPSETSVLVEIVSGVVHTEHTEVTLMVTDVVWEPTRFLVRPALSLRGVGTSVDEKGVFVTGEVVNAGSVAASSVRVVAILKDAGGYPVFAASSALGPLGGDSTEPFTVRFPPDQELARRMIPSATELHLEAQ
ncbi:MAG: hypothetical protein Q8P88_02875 [Candidatus Jorgensenbacteria bacterium]|nr:hypothetical protein [Candidatus Jorgensenbacteria bacterium]